MRLASLINGVTTAGDAAPGPGCLLGSAWLLTAGVQQAVENTALLLYTDRYSGLTCVAAIFISALLQQRRLRPAYRRRSRLTPLFARAPRRWGQIVMDRVGRERRQASCLVWLIPEG